jgi:hypothetical protein
LRRYRLVTHVKDAVVDGWEDAAFTFQESVVRRCGFTLSNPH